MTPASIPAAAPTATANATPSAAGGANAAQPGQAAPFDFISMLGQLVEGAAPAPAAAAVVAQLATEAETASDATTQSEASAPTLLLALPITLPPEPPKVTPSTAPQAAMIGVELELSRSTTESAALKLESQLVSQAAEQFKAALASPATEAFAAAMPETAQMSDGPSVLTQSPLDVSASTRTTSSIEAAISRPVHTPVGAQTWNEEVGSRVIMMAEHGKQTASLRLSPEHLGPLEIRVTINDDQAQVWFGAAHADTRAAIEHALPRLRELFAAQGMSLTDAGVSHQAPREQSPGAGSQQSPRALGGAHTEEGAPISAVAIKLGLVDAYA